MRALVVDLEKQTLEWNEIPRNTIRMYLGGRGLGVRYLYDHLSPDLDPLGPENILSFWTSPIMATGAISTVKVCGVTKSPLTNTILMSLMGGHFGPRMRMAGVDAIIFLGRAEKPVYLKVVDGIPQLVSAEPLWGKNVRATTNLLLDEVQQPNAQVACIGQAGEKQVLFASIMHGGDAMGRGGIGAVMGSKNLKAVIVAGSQKPYVAQPELYRELLKEIGATYHNSVPVNEFGKYGTTSHVNDENYFGIYPTRNYQTARFEKYESINHENLYQNFVTKRRTCFACSVRCRRDAEIKEGEFSGTVTEGPEYETLWSMGGNCGNANLNSILVANELCLEYGLDTISTGMVISFAQECYEKGLISEELIKGMDLSFGNADSILALIHLIAKREGFGDILANGTLRASKVLGPQTFDYAMQVKGLELAGYDPRGAKGMGLGYATSPRGGCHERGFLTGEVFGTPPGVDRLSYENKGLLVKTTQDTVAVKDSLGFCVLSSAGTSMEKLVDLFSAVTGEEVSVMDLMVCGERISNLERLINLREGFTSADDTLPKRLLIEPIPGPNDTPQVVDLSRMLQEYYTVRGWDESGVPTIETLKRLGLIDDK